MVSEILQLFTFILKMKADFVVIPHVLRLEFGQIQSKMLHTDLNPGLLNLGWETLTETVASGGSMSVGPGATGSKLLFFFAVFCSHKISSLSR